MPHSVKSDVINKHQIFPLDILNCFVQRKFLLSKILQKYYDAGYLRYTLNCLDLAYDYKNLVQLKDLEN